MPKSSDDRYEFSLKMIAEYTRVGGMALEACEMLVEHWRHDRDPRSNPGVAPTLHECVKAARKALAERTVVEQVDEAEREALRDAVDTD